MGEGWCGEGHGDLPLLSSVAAVDSEQMQPGAWHFVLARGSVSTSSRRVRNVCRAAGGRRPEARWPRAAYVLLPVDLGVTSRNE